MNTASYTTPATARLRLDRGLRDAVIAFERLYFEFHLANADRSMTRVAATTGMERTSLYRKLRALGLDGGLSLPHDSA